MIDDKKINEAANKLCDYGSILSSEYRIDGFKKGVKWAINDFLKDLLHPANEEPKEGFDLVYINKAKEFREISSYNSDRFNDLFGNGWKAACRRFGIHKWTYKDDLL